LAFDRRKLLESAQRLIRKGQIRRAIGDYEKLVADDPKNIRIRSKLADLYVRDHNVVRAVEEYAKLAKQYETEDLNYRAIAMYKKLLTLKPKRTDIHYWLADLYKKEGLFGNARVLYQNVIKLNPEDETARQNINEIDQDMSGVNVLRGKNQVPSPSDLESAFGLLDDDQSFTQEQVTDDEVLEIEVPYADEISKNEEVIDQEEPNDSPAENVQTIENTRHHETPNPYLTHQKIDLTQPPSPEKDLESHYHLGVAYMEMDLIDKAIPEFEAALEYNPKTVDCLVMLGLCYLQKGLFDRSVFYLEKASGIKGLSEEEYNRINRELARAYEACGRKKKG
jgi:tetratricopeptide (TPR) repeat protein